MSWQRRIMLWLLALAPFAPFAFCAYVFATAGFPFAPVDGDVALCELAIRELGFDAPRVGAYSRLGFHHPGPLHYYLLAPGYAVIPNGGGIALAFSAAVLSGLLLVVPAWLLGRRIGAGAAFAFVIVSLLFTANHGGQAIGVWEPALARATLWTAFGGVLLAVHGHRAGLWLAAAAASLGLQVHLSVAVPMGLCVALVAWGMRESDGRRLRPRDFAVALGGALVLWLPPLAEQFAADGGNLSKIVSTLSEQEATLSFGDAFGHASRATGEQVTLMTGVESGSGLVFVVQVLASLGLVVVGLRSGRRLATAAGLVGVAFHVAAMISALRVVGEYSSHLMAPAALAPLPMWFGWLWVGIDAARSPRVRRWVGAAVIAVTLGLALLAGRSVGIAAVSAAYQPGTLAAPGFETALPLLASHLRERGLTACVVEDPGGGHFLDAAGLVNGLRIHGLDAVPDERHAWAYPRRFAAPERPARLLLGPVGPADAFPISARAAVRILAPGD